MKLTIAQALRKIKKLRGQISVARSEAENSLNHVEGAPPAFSFDESITEMDKLKMDLVDLEAKVATTNALTKVCAPDGTEITLTAAVKLLQELRGSISWLNNLDSREQTRTTNERSVYIEDGKYSTKTEVNICALPKKQKAEMLAKLKNEFDSLNDEVEKMNHKTELLG